MINSKFLREILSHFILVWDDGFTSWLPVGGADNSMPISMLERLDESKSFFNISSHLFIIDHDRPYHPLIVDYKQSSESCPMKSIARIFYQDTVVFGDLFGDVCQKGDLNFSQASLISRCLPPGQMGEVRIHRNSQHFSPDFSKGLCMAAVADDLSGAHIGEVKWIEKQYNIFVFVVGEAELFE